VKRSKNGAEMDYRLMIKKRGLSENKERDGDGLFEWR
jgi:hypothetical protein